MNYQFHQDQFSEDLHAVGKFFVDFLKSFGPSPTKIENRPIGIFEAMYIRFRLSLVEMGISQVIRSVLVLIVGIIVYFVLFQYAGPLFKAIIGFGFLSYYIWLFAPHLAKDGKLKDGKIVGKPVSMISGYLIDIHNKRVEFQSGFFPSEKKK